MVAGLAPTHENPAPHGLSLSQLSPPFADGAAHTVFWLTHRRPGPQDDRLVHESPAFGGAAQTPQFALRGMAQNAL
jgi:hypothetical protein